MNWLIKNFLRGLIIVVPVAATVYLVYQTFVTLDRLLRLPTPGVGIAILLGGIILIGALASNFIGRELFHLMEKVFTKAPLIRIIYASIKDLLEAFVGDKKRFDRPVSVALSADGALRSFGFVTQDDLTHLALPGHVAVYLPFSYSMAGTLVVVPRERVAAIDADSASVMALVVSGGISRV